MRILFLDAYFEPEQIAFTHLENDLLEGLVQEGHEVEIICPTPTRGVTSEVKKIYKKRKHEDLYDGQVHVTRFYAPHEGKNPLLRALRYFWCNFRTYQIGKNIRDINAVFANSTPPTQGWIAGRVAMIQRVPFIYSLQDVFPDSLVTTGMAKKGSLPWRIGRKLENATYIHASSIIAITESIKQNLVQKGVNQKRIKVISNWIDLDAINKIPKEDNSLFDEFGISRDKFILLYAGNFGSAQGAEIILDVADRLQENNEIQFVIFGAGMGYAAAEQRANSMSNVFIHPLLSQERISEVYSMGDVALITCKKGVGKSGMPSKTWSIMACNTPIIASFDQDSEMNTILQASGAGKCVEPENVDALYNAIICATTNAWIYYGREYVKEHASKSTCVKRYIKAIQEIAVSKL